MSIRKVRFSATIRRDLAEALNRAGANRSALLESILEAWLEEQKRKLLDQEMEEYYQRYAEAESKEEREWIGHTSKRLDAASRSSDDR